VKKKYILIGTSFDTARPSKYDYIPTPNENQKLLKQNNNFSFTQNLPPIHTIGGLPSRSDGRSEPSQYDYRVFPVNAGIRDTDTLLQSTRPLLRNILTALNN
jgi:hypothetical protein